MDGILFFGGRFCGGREGEAGEALIFGYHVLYYSLSGASLYGVS